MDNNNQQHRYRFIELIAYWEGRINTSHLMLQFGISRPQSSNDINAYIDLAPGNLIYNKSLKVHQPVPEYHCRFITGDVVEYLNWLQHPAQFGKITTTAKSLPNIALTLPARKVSPHIMRGLIAAIRQGRRIDVDYVSLSNPNREGRVIAPHTFVNTGLRWHLRAWCEKSNQYRDFVLSRFRGEPELLEKSIHTAEQDDGWNTQVNIILQPDPRLSAAKREVLENDYQMQNGELHITTKGCLVQYLLREIQVNTKMLDGTPEAQQLVLVNPHDIKPWLFEG
jgi:hypothetical protein